MDAALFVGPDAEGRWLRIEGGRIVATGLGPDAGARRDAEHLDAAGARLAPGRVNAHTHLYSGLAPLGLPMPATPPPSFVGILEQIWWRLDRALDPDSLAAGARLHLAEAALAGTTSLIDHHESPAWIAGSLDPLAAAAASIGVRLAVTFGATERNGGPEEAQAGLEECRRAAAALDRPGWLRTLVGLHASFTVSDETVRAAARLAESLGCGLHVHVAEAASDVEDARARGYDGVVDRLARLGALRPDSVFAHGVHLRPDELRRALDAGVWFVQNPRSNAGNRVGYAAVLGAGPRVALGTDGYPSDMKAEAAGLIAEADRAGVAVDPEARLAAGRALAGRLLGLELTGLVEGADADLVVETDDGPPRHVVVGGRVVVRDGRLTTAALESIRAEARAAAPRLWARMKEL